MSLMSPNGYFGNMLSTIHLLASTGVTFQPELHVRSEERRVGKEC